MQKIELTPSHGIRFAKGLLLAVKSIAGSLFSGTRTEWIIVCWNRMSKKSLRIHPARMCSLTTAIWTVTG